jgi:hypothetical protein
VGCRSGPSRSRPTPIEVESATGRELASLDWWVKDRQEWWGRVRGADGRQRWIKALDLRPRERLTALTCLAFVVLSIHLMDVFFACCALEDNPPSLLKGFCILLERCHASFVTVEPEILMLALVSLLVLLVSANQFCGSVLTRTL